MVGTTSAPATSYTDTNNLAAGTTYQYEIAAVNSSGASAFSNVVTVTTPPWPLQLHRRRRLVSPRGRRSISPRRSWSTRASPGRTRIRIGSGVPNLLAYALQLNPATAQITDVPTPTPNNGHLQITYFVPTSITDINYIVEVSTNLQTWNTGPGYTQVTSSVAGANGTTITGQDTLPTTTPRRYLHLRVTQQ